MVAGAEGAVGAHSGMR
ncbi:unnamed protein product, partial [Rotaria sp. Silwood1]